jgi:hypothetical protein
MEGAQCVILQAMTRITKVAVAACFAAAIVSAAAQTPRAVWRLDLSTLGPYKDAAITTQGSSRGFDIDFADNDIVVVRTKFKSGLHHNADGSIDPVVSNDVIFAIDAKEGVVRNFQAWKGWRGSDAVTLGGRFHVAGDSTCLINIGDRLLKLSPTLRVLAMRELPLKRTTFNGYRFQDSWWLLTDPRTKKGLLGLSPVSANGPVAPERHWISVQTLEDESPTSLAPGSVFGTLVGDSVVYSGGIPFKDTALIQRESEPPRPLCGQCVGQVIGSFGNGLIFLNTRHSHLVVDTDGKVYYRGGRLGGRADRIDADSGAITANRIAFEFGHLGRTLEVTVVVLDVDAKKEIMRFKVSQEPENEIVGRFVEEKFVAPTLALSPDGRKLAFLSGTVLSLFNVP